MNCSRNGLPCFDQQIFLSSHIYCSLKCLQDVRGLGDDGLSSWSSGYLYRLYQPEKS